MDANSVYVSRLSGRRAIVSSAEQTLRLGDALESQGGQEGCWVYNVQTSCGQDSATEDVVVEAAVSVVMMLSNFLPTQKSPPSSPCHHSYTTPSFWFWFFGAALFPSNGFFSPAMFCRINCQRESWNWCRSCSRSQSDRNASLRVLCSDWIKRAGILFDCMTGGVGQTHSLTGITV